MKLLWNRYNVRIVTEPYLVIHVFTVDMKVMYLLEKKTEPETVKLFLIQKKTNFMGRLLSMKYADFKEDEWKIIKELPVILQCLKDNSMIKITDIDDKIHKMTFQKRGKIFFDKIEDKYRFYWEDDDLIWLAKESVIGIRLSSHHMEEVDTEKVKNDAMVALYT